MVRPPKRKAPEARWKPNTIKILTSFAAIKRERATKKAKQGEGDKGDGNNNGEDDKGEPRAMKVMKGKQGEGDKGDGNKGEPPKAKGKAKAKSRGGNEGQLALTKGGYCVIYFEINLI